MKLKNVLFAAVALAASQTAVASPNLIVNGDFESSSFSGDFDTYYAGSSALTGWSIDMGSVDLINTYWTPDSGFYSLDLNGLKAGSISQEFDTVIGQKYHVSFSLAGNPGGDPEKAILVGLGGDIYTFNTSGQSTTSMGWVSHGFEYIAATTKSTLYFDSLNESYYGPALDSISVTAVPEPESYAMFLAGIALMAGIARRRSNLLK